MFTLKQDTLGKADKKILKKTPDKDNKSNLRHIKRQKSYGKSRNTHGPAQRLRRKSSKFTQETRKGKKKQPSLISLFLF